MYSSEDLERFYFQYQTEALPHEESVQSFCNRNKVPYNIFYKWFKDTRNKIVEVQVDGRPSEPSGKEARPASPIRISADLQLSNGLRISKKGLSFQELRNLIGKLEVLC